MNNPQQVVQEMAMMIAQHAADLAIARAEIADLRSQLGQKDAEG